MVIRTRPMYTQPLFVLTGGPCGGKSSFIHEICQDPVLGGLFLSLPEAIFVSGGIGIKREEKLFQRLMVETQFALENALRSVVASEDHRYILCDRGSLDPLAYWIYQGWNESEFFNYTRTNIESHYNRYKAVIHLVTTADGAIDYYKSTQNIYRNEEIDQAIRIDRLLHQVWCGHPAYYLVDNVNQNWKTKYKEAVSILMDQFNKL